jgi:penicillin-binding protein 1A
MSLIDMKRRKRTGTSPKIPEPKLVREKESLREKLSRKKVLTVVSIGMLTLIVLIGFIYYLSLDLPSLAQLERIDPELATKIFASDGNLISTIYSENRTFTPYNKIPQYIIDCLLSTEDRRFYDHWGFDIIRFIKAFIVNIRHMEIRQGGSTLTQQLARNLYLGREKSIIRKLREIITAIQIERTYSKREIIEMYLNIIAFDYNAYGIHAAARRFFSKDVHEIAVEEGAVLIAILNGPSHYNPIRHPDRAQQRRNLVLRSLYDTGHITKTCYDSLIRVPLKLDISTEKYKIAPYFVDHIEKKLANLEDSLHVNTQEDGLRVYTTLDTRLQALMDRAIDKVMPAIQARVRNYKEITKLKAELPETADKDSLFNEKTVLQIAFICIDPHTGHILAMVGGRDYSKYKFNNAIQALRQPGSSFKPFAYTAAIDNGYLPCAKFKDQPYTINNPDGTRWTPENFDKTYGDPLTLRQALRKSRNLPSVWLIDEITPGLVVKYARQMGISSSLRAVPSLVLGTSEVRPIDLVSSFGIFANNGVLVEPISITRIEDKTGNVIYHAESKEKEVLGKETVFIMNDMLQDVANRGTGAAARSIYHIPYNIPIGGKTGTTNDYTDAWFIGFTPHLVAGVWVGFADSQLKHGLTGSQGALPFWATFIKSVYDSLELPPAAFPEQPVGVVKLRICSQTKKLATDYCPTSDDPQEDWEYFNIKYQPTEKCDVHTGQPASGNRRRRAF